MKTSIKSLICALLASTVAMPALAFEEGKLTIWTGTNRDHDALGEVTAKFTESTGIEVVLEEFEDVTEKFQQSAAAGDGPDLIMWAHDRFGEWSSGGLIAPLNPGEEIVKGILPSAWDAVNSGGKSWGYPVLVEAVALIYNKGLIDAAPASFEEIGGLEIKDGKTAIMWDYANTYFSMPLLMAGGGYAFKKSGDSYDGKDTGVNNAGAKAGAAMIKKLIDDGTMPKGVDYGVMDGAMKSGEVAMVINGPWAWPAFKEAGIDFGIAPVPSVAGKASPPFLGVQALALNAASPNADLAIELVENHILTDEGLAKWNENGALGALADISAGAAQDDPNIAATLEIAATAVPMPSNPEMGAFWGAMGPALGSITSGEAEVDAALDNAAKQILGGE